MQYDSKKSFLKLWFPVIIYAIIIFWGSSQKQPFGVDLGICGIDSVLHAMEYAVLGLLLSRAIAGSTQKISVSALIFIAFILGTLYGLTDEFHQYFVPGRDCSALDLTFDAIGSFLGAATFTVFIKGNPLRGGNPLNG